uniref:Ankyrin repeat and zinc finger domain-containing protein 1 n=1 Tax=Balaenoptera musculus TaxID=9771 RepID=A0A8C0C5A4_BALMU
SGTATQVIPGAPSASVSVSLFDLKADTPVLQGLRLVSHAPGEALAQALQTSFPGIWEGLGKPLQGPLDISEKLFCSTCDQTFQNHQNREHYKLDWHQFNLKQHLKDKPLLSALDFEKQSSTGDLSSISGSEDSDLASEEDLQILDEERAEFEKPNRPRGYHPHRVLFQNAQGQFLYAYCCVLGPHMFVLLLRHPGAPRRSRTAATEPAKWRSQGLRGARGCRWALCWCCFQGSVDTQNLSPLHSAGQVGHSPGASGCPGCGFPLCWSQPEALQ